MLARRLCTLGAGAMTLLASREAHAQLHWDGAAQAGVMKRVLVSRPAGGDNASFGPAAQLTGHLALFPLIRVGGYLGHDISPMSGETSARDLTWGGLRVKLMSPWPRGAFRTWLFVGFGYTGIYARSSAASRPLPAPASARTATLVGGAGGGFFDVPFGVGGSYAFRKPFALCAELGMRAGFAHSGSAYEAPGPPRKTLGQPDDHAPPAGIDRFAVGLTAGFMVDL